MENDSKAMMAGTFLENKKNIREENFTVGYLQNVGPHPATHVCVCVCVCVCVPTINENTVVTGFSFTSSFIQELS